MFKVFISYAPEDTPTLAKLLKWMEPLRRKYFLHIYYNRYSRFDEQNKLDWEMEMHSAHLYLFLTSHHSLSMASVQHNEVPAALKRQEEKGKNLVKIHPILVSPSHWKDNSQLLLVKREALPKKKELSKYDLKEEGYLEIITTLQKEIEKIRRDLIEEAVRKKQSITSFTQEFELPKAIAPSKTQYRMGKLMEMVWACMLLFLIYIVFQLACNQTTNSNQYTPPLKNQDLEEFKDF